jgi:TRAP transporter TAXI family solute receptor
MKPPTIAVAVLTALATPIIFAPAANTAVPTDIAVVNRGVVELQTGRAAGISVRIAEDLANLIDDGATRRVLPVIGKESLQNITDLKLLRGIDMAILQADVLDYARQQNSFPGLEGWATYIAKLYNEEFHLLARPDMQSVADLDGQTVNIDRPASGTAITATRIFDFLNLTPKLTNDTEEVALEKLKNGEIAAVAFVAGKPAPLFDGIGNGQGLHLLSIPLSAKITSAYLPARITAADYPGLVTQDHPVDTIAVGAVLAVANLQPASERYRNVANFVDTFFTDFQSLLTPGHHPKWRDVNLAADVPGWKRFPAADLWLKRNAAVAKGPAPDNLKQVFERFIEERLLVAGGTMSQDQKDDLFNQFQHWQSTQR